jgi:hypothetical protein
MVPALSLLSPLLAGIPLFQDPPAGVPGDVLGRFVLDGRPAFVTRTDAALEMAFHSRRKDEGKQAIELLVDSAVTRRAAAARNLLPTTAEVKRYWQDLQAQIRAAGRDPKEAAAVRNMTEAQLFDFLAVQMAQERLVRAELSLRANEKVSGEMLRLWLQEQKRRARIETNPDRLPAGVVAMVDDQAIGLGELGDLLLRTADDADVQDVVQRIAFLQTVESLARTHGVQLTEADLDRAIAERREQAARDPRYRGIGYEQLLESQGFTLAALRELRVFRAQVLLPMLAQRLVPDQELRRQLAEDRAGTLDRVGARRRIGVIFARASDTPNALIPDDFAGAKARLDAARLRLGKDDFALVARIESDEPRTKQRGGDTGWHHKAGANLPKLVVDAAFALADGAISEPLRGDDGYYLVKVLETEPEPDDATLLRRLREQASEDLKRQLVRDLQLQYGDEPQPTKK